MGGVEWSVVRDHFTILVVVNITVLFLGSGVPNKKDSLPVCSWIASRVVSRDVLHFELGGKPSYFFVDLIEVVIFTRYTFAV